MENKCKNCGHEEGVHKTKDFYPKIDGINRDGSCAYANTSEDCETIYYKCKCKKFEEDSA